MYTKEQKLDAYRKLPEEIKAVISAEDVTDKITAVGNKHNLLIDKQGMLVDEIGLVMFGLTHPDKFVDSLKNRLGISHDDAEAIATDVNNEILLEIREELKKISAKNAETEKTSNLAHDSLDPVETDEHHATLKREDILRDIEDPAPTQNPTLTRTTLPLARTVIAKDAEAIQPAVAKTSPPPSNLPVAYNDNDLPTVIPQMDHSYPTPAKKEVAPDSPATTLVRTVPLTQTVLAKETTPNIVSAKLSGVVVTTTTRIPEKPSATKTPYKTDPYREGIN